jgi:hypothetical protein
MGESINGCNGIRHSGIEHVCMESDAYKRREGWATREGNAAFPTNARRRNESHQFTFVEVIKASAGLGALGSAVHSNNFLKPKENLLIC